MNVPAVAEAVPETRHKVREHLQRFGIESAGAVELALGEALTNVILHAYPTTSPGDVEIAVVVDDDTIEVVVRDSGLGLDPNRDSQPAGYGVLLIEALTDRCEFDRHAGGTTIRMEFDRPTSP